MSKKNNKKNEASKKKRFFSDWMIAIGSVFLVFAVAVAIWWMTTRDGVLVYHPTEPTTQTQDTSGTEDSNKDTEPTPTEEEDVETDLGNGLILSEPQKYAGVFMEDGSDDAVSDIMMVILRNESDRDLQLAHIELAYPDFSAEFEATNLPAGESVVLLEKNRIAYTDADYQGVITENVAFFSEPMSVMEDRVQITGENGYLNVKNISDQPLGLTYIYYKNSASDIFYGGITYRTKIEEGIKPGETVKVAAGHYSPQNSKILQVQFAEEVTE